MATLSSGSLDQPLDLAADVEQLLEDLARKRPDRRQLVAGECMPVVDVFETERAVEIVLDLPGVGPEAVRILFKQGVVLIVGAVFFLAPTQPASFLMATINSNGRSPYAWAFLLGLLQAPLQDIVLSTGTALVGILAHRLKLGNQSLRKKRVFQRANRLAHQVNN